jgi:hypothetical protein
MIGVEFGERGAGCNVASPVTAVTPLHPFSNVTGEREFTQSHFVAIFPRAGRSAEFCPAHFTGQTLRIYVQSTESKSGQRAASGCSTRSNIRGATWKDTFWWGKAQPMYFGDRRPCTANRQAIAERSDPSNAANRRPCVKPGRKREPTSRYQALPPRIFPFHPIRPGLRSCGGTVHSPAPVETDRRPENVRQTSRFSVDNAPSLLRERPCNPTAQQGLAEGEPIKAQAKFREKTRGVKYSLELA